MGEKEAADRADGVVPGLNYGRYAELIVRFWKGAKLSRAEMGELNELHRWNVTRVWESTAANDEVKS